MTDADVFGLRRPMPCLSLWQPWASLCPAGLKKHETRHWPTKIRGLIAIHAAKSRQGFADAPEDLCKFALGPDWQSELPFGEVVAVAELTGCYPTEVVADVVTYADYLAGNYASGRYAFRLENVRPLAKGVTLLGRQGFFGWVPPVDLEDLLLPANDHADAAAAFARWRQAA